MHSVGIEPTLFRTRALSVRLNRSAKSAYNRYLDIHIINIFKEFCLLSFIHTYLILRPDLYGGIGKLLRKFDPKPQIYMPNH